MSIIEDLQNNEKPFGLMSEEMQAKILTIDPKDVECLMSTPPVKWGSCDNFSWTNMSRHHNNTYRLRPDYTEEPEIEKCKIEWQGLSGFKLGYVKEHHVRHLHQALDDPDFIGFLYEDEEVRTSPVKYSPRTGATSHWGMFKSIESGKTKVLHATHVLFRRQKSLIQERKIA